MPEIVNGFVCLSCGQVGLAECGVDPARRYQPREAGPAALAAAAPDRGTDPLRPPGEARGTRLNLRA